MNEKTLDTCHQSCLDDDNCTHFWLTDNGRCCPKHSVTNISDSRNAPDGNFYELIEGFNDETPIYSNHSLLIPLILFILIILYCRK